ncbi:MAG: MarR family winged helix-turn-helix transcriptional regulator [Caulobacterales bacterium]|jgi:DNA-binding MarR family transcriptional regulator
MTEARERADVTVLTQIAAIAQLADNRLGRVLPAGLSAAQFAVLAHLARTGGDEHPQSLARAALVTKGAMTNTLQRLTAQGLANVTADPDDARRKQVAITAAGIRAFQEGLIASRPQLAAMRAAFPAEEFDAALPFLRRLREWLSSDGRGAGS